MHVRLPFLCCAALAPAVLAQQDLRVPSGYPDVQAAIDAAAPGDRILLEPGAVARTGWSGDLVIDKSLTIESDTPGLTRKLSIYAVSSSGVSGFLRVTRLTPAIPLVLRDIDIQFYDMGSWWTPPMGLRIDAPGELRMENVSLSNSSTTYLHALVADIDTTMVWMRGCTVSGFSVGPSNPCPDTSFNPNGGDALKVKTDLLVMEDCTCTGGDAAYLRFFASCNPPYVSGDGGFAIQAETKSSILTRCQFRDGNGSWFEPGPWISVPATAPGNSQLVSAGGELVASGVSHEPGLTGQVGPMPASHGLATYPGQYYAPVSFTGSGRLGEQVRVGLSLPRFYSNMGTLLIGFAWGPAATPIGTLGVDPSTIALVLPVSTTSSVPLSIPTYSSIVDLPIVAQLITLDGVPASVWNASGLWVSR